MVRFRVATARDCDLELWDARRKAPVFERVFGVKTSFALAAPLVAASG